ncbi:MAG: DUF1835 domain-containing protein [Balneolaceae bacterium]|nr:DUF1835 domain-containing protein [Balneolaceae bacterium]
MNYHILNSDALAERFPEEIEGNQIIFRECLIEGPLKAENLDHFLSIRESYLTQTYPEHGEDYYAKFTRSELEKLSTIPNNARVYLWFEEDLFCLMNALYVLYLLTTSNRNYQVFWVHPPMSMQYGFAGLSPDELRRAPEHAKEIKEDDLKTASKLWELIATENYNPISNLRFTEPFDFLNNGIELLLSFKVKGQAEAILKSIISETEPLAFGPVFRAFHAKAPEYGLGDLQVKRLYDKIINH